MTRAQRGKRRLSNADRRTAPSSLLGGAIGSKRLRPRPLYALPAKGSIHHCGPRPLARRIARPACRYTTNRIDPGPFHQSVVRRLTQTLESFRSFRGAANGGICPDRPVSEGDLTLPVGLIIVFAVELARDPSPLTFSLILAFVHRLLRLQVFRIPSPPLA